MKKDVRKPGRLIPALAVVGGAALAAFELRHFHAAGPAVWFWLFVAGLMIVMGLIGLLEKPPREGD